MDFFNYAMSCGTGFKHRGTEKKNEVLLLASDEDLTFYTGKAEIRHNNEQVELEMEEVSDSTKTCLVCEQIRPRDEFFSITRNGTKRKLRNYCNTCRETKSQQQINDIINQKLQPKRRRRFNPASVVLPDNDMSFLTKDKIILYGARREFRTEIPLTSARRLASEKAAYIISPNTIRLILDRTDMKAFVLHRDGYRCVLCGHPTLSVQRIVSKSEGGMRTPSNLRSVCQNCLKSKSKSTDRSVTYAIPVYWNGTTCIHSAVENPSRKILKYTRTDSHLHCFCDISENPSVQRCYGMAVVMAGGGVNGIQVRTRRISLEYRSSSVAEAEAVLWCIQMLSNLTRTHVTIYTDTNFGPLRNKKSKQMIEVIRRIHDRPRNVQIVYLNRQGKRTQLYRLAHKYSRVEARHSDNCTYMLKAQFNQIFHEPSGPS